MSTAEVLAGLEPALVWERFAELIAIPRPPKEEGQARAYVLGRAEALGFESAVDAEGNVLVRVPAATGREDAATVVLQAHLDMVCERDPASEYDPREGRIRVVVEGDWVIAPETTLGADNGIGVAAALAVAEDLSLEHGPLELLFTVAEEQGLDGAKAITPDFVTGRLLVNLDGTSDRSLTIGCAGSVHTFTRFDLRPHQPPAEDAVALFVELAGARGGHSGADIHRGRANAIKGLFRVLSRAFEQAPFELAELQGGVSRNAIPRKAFAVVVLPRESQATFRDAAARSFEELHDRHHGLGDELRLSVDPVEPYAAADQETTRRALDLAAVQPTGVLAVSPDRPGEIETSASLNVAKAWDVLELACMIRSANSIALEDVVGGIVAAGRLAGADVEVLRSYPPWRPDLDSRLLSVAQRTFKRLNGEPPHLEVVHGGLECAIIGGRLPGIEMISLGPEIAGMHAPGERLSVPATQRFYRLLGALLDDLSR